MTSLPFRASLLTGVTFSLFTAAPAVAQTQSETKKGDEVIVVTAQKRGQDVEDVPFTVNVLGGDALEKQGIQSLDDLSQRIPGLDLGVGFGRSDTRVSIRGVGSQPFNSPTVVVFVDGFTTGLRDDVTSELFDLERVEVLKGPQATLYGRNAIGGTINYITRAPTFDLSGRAEVGYGTFDAYSARLAVGGPLVDDLLAIRFSGSLTGRDGYWDNILTGEENVDRRSDKSGRLAFRLTPSTNFRSDLALSYTKSNDDCGDCIQAIVGFDPLNPGALGRGELDANDLSGAFNQEQGYFDRQILTAVLTNKYDFENVSIQSISGYSHLEIDSVIDLNRAPGSFFGIDGIVTDRVHDIFSQEVQLSSQEDRRFDWIFGLYYYNNDEDEVFTGNTAFGNVPVGSADVKTRNYAAFFNGSLELNNRLELGFGLRYDVEKTHLVDRLFVAEYRTKSEELLPRVSLSFGLSDDANLYATVSRGYHSGGVNQTGSFGVPPETEYGPEYVWNYEIGLKGHQGGAFDYEAALFWIDWSDQQVTSSSGIITYLVNAGKTRIRGLEARAAFRPTERLTLDAALAVTDAKFRDFLDQSGAPTVFGGSAQRAGARTALVPDVTFDFGVEHVTPIGNGWELGLRGGFNYVGDRALDPVGILNADGYVLGNLAVSLGNPHIRFTAFANNITDAEYASSASLFLGLPPLVYAGSPRTAGIRAELTF